MVTSIQETYRRYLRYDISLDDLRDWLALNQWELSENERGLADEADVALAHFDDGYGDENDLRRRLSAALEKQVFAVDYLI